jgi:hypothetical protein
MSQRGLRGTLWLGTIAVVLFLWGTSLPLGIPGEWTWSRLIAADADAIDRWLGLLVAGVTAAAFLGISWLGARGIEAAGRLGVAVRLASLAAAGFIWLWVVQDSPPGTWRLQKSVLVLYSPGTSGYFFHDRFRVHDTRRFLSGYEAWVRKGDVLHFGTHPPGLFLFHRGVTHLCHADPNLTRAALATCPETVRETFDLLDQFPMGAPSRMVDADRASLWLAALLTQALGVLALVPIYLLIRRSAGRHAAWWGASLWPLVPALAIFLPKSDVLYPCVGAAFLWCWLEATARRSAVLGAIAGGLIFLALSTTLAFLPVGLLAVAISLLEWWTERRLAQSEPATGEERAIATALHRLGRVLVPWLAGGLAFFALIVLARAVFDLNLPAVWLQNYRNHAGFYGQFTRTWWKWILVNPLEAAIAIGWPVAFMAATTVVGALTRRDDSRRVRIIALCVAGVWGLLWISGKNSGEAARLWLLFDPWAVWLAGLSFDRLRSDASPRQDHVARDVLILQAVAAVSTVLRVFGFDFMPS